MRILLISPPFKCFTRLYSYGFPLGLSILATIAQEEGQEVSVCEIDKFITTDKLNLSEEHSALNKYISSVNDLGHPAWGELKRNLNLFKPEIIGITAYTTTFASALRTAQICKAYNPRIITILGGPHPTARPDDCLESNSVDFIVIGEGEIPFRQLLKFLDKSSGSLDLIPAIGYRQNGDIRINPRCDFINDLDSIPIPDRDLLWYRNRYSAQDFGLLLASRGCPFDCTYCFHFWGKRIRHRSIGNVIKEIEMVKNKYSTIHFSFKDDVLTLDNKWMTELCKEIKSLHLGITWECTTRADSLNSALLDNMISAGCKVIKIGIESGSPSVLKQTKKNIDREGIIKLARLLNSRKVFWSGYFMYGLPFESEKDLISNYRFMQTLKPHYAALCLYQISPSTELYEYGVKESLYYREVPLKHFFQVNPKDYYIIDPQRRSSYIDPERFKELELFLVRKFDNYNTSILRILKRGWVRKSIYRRKTSFLFKEINMAIRWLLKNYWDRIKARLK